MEEKPVSINQSIYLSRKEYFQEYYKENKTNINGNAKKRFAGLSGEQKEKLNAGRRKRRRKIKDD